MKKLILRTINVFNNLHSHNSINYCSKCHSDEIDLGRDNSSSEHVIQFLNPKRKNLVMLNKINKLFEVQHNPHFSSAPVGRLW